MKIKFEIHESHLPLWENKEYRYVILMGGRANGRSGSASRFALSQILSSEYTKGAIMRAVHSDIRTSCWGEIMNRVNENNIHDSFKIVDNEMYIECGGNSLRAHGFKASSGSLTARLKSLAEYNFIWLEEAEEIGEDEFRTLDDSLRTKKGRTRIVITLNTPPKNHWMLSKWFDLIPSDKAPGFFVPKLKEGLKDVIFIPGNWQQNKKNLDPHTIQRYKDYQFSNPSYYWQVIEGLSPEEVRGKIFSGWQQIDSIPKEARLVRFGEDFGWFPDPACAVAIYYWNGSYIVDQLAYGNYLSNEYLAQCIREVDAKRGIVTIADSAEPKSIKEQNTYGIIVRGAEKGSDSVSYRIKILSEKKIYVTKRSKEVWESYEKYAWKEDRDGNSTGEPDHEFSHCMDAIMYPIASLHNRPKVAKQSNNSFKQHVNLGL